MSRVLRFTADASAELEDAARWYEQRHAGLGMAFLAEVCRYGDVETQQAVHDEIKRAGAPAGRVLWLRVVFDDARKTGQWNIADKVNRQNPPSQ